MKIVENQTVILGPPGCGKTTTLLDIVDKELKAGTEPEEIAFLSFTRKAVNEAADRASKKFGLNRSRFPYFQTIHSMCFRALGLSRSLMMDRHNYDELGDWLGYKMSVRVDIADGSLIFPDDEKGTKLLFLDNYARITNLGIERSLKETRTSISYTEAERFCRGYEHYRKSRGLFDFTDLLSKMLEEERTIGTKVVIVDEAQDLSFLQWEVIKSAFRNVNHAYIAGDDDQSIFKWSGADLTSFLKLTGDVRILSQSYRLPLVVHSRAARLISRVKQRFPKEFNPTDKQGSITFVPSLDFVKLDPNESTMVLCRNVFLMKDVHSFLENRSVSFEGRGNYKSVDPDHIRAIMAWEKMRKGLALNLEDALHMYSFLRIGEILDRGGKSELSKVKDLEIKLHYESFKMFFGLKAAPIWHKALLGIPAEQREYYISLLRSGVKLLQPPNVSVNTIHGVKGGEADHIILLSDMAKRTYEEMQLDPCSEVRVAYVGLTRSKNKVTIVQPSSCFKFDY